MLYGYLLLYECGAYSPHGLERRSVQAADQVFANPGHTHKRPHAGCTLEPATRDDVPAQSHAAPVLPRAPQDDVMLELHVEDMHGEVPEDMLSELAFFVPPGNQDFPSAGDLGPPAKVRSSGAHRGVRAPWDKSRRGICACRQKRARRHTCGRAARSADRRAWVGRASQARGSRCVWLHACRVCAGAARRAAASRRHRGRRGGRAGVHLQRGACKKESKRR